FSVTRIGSSARSPMSSGLSSRTPAATSALPVMALPTPTRPSSVRTSTTGLMSSSGLSSSAPPPSTLPPQRPVRRTSVIFMAPPRAGTLRQSGNLERFVVQDHELIRAQGEARIATTFVIAELDLEDAGGDRFDKGPHLPPEQAALRQIFGEGDDI